MDNRVLGFGLLVRNSSLRFVNHWSRSTKVTSVAQLFQKWPLKRLHQSICSLWHSHTDRKQEMNSPHWTTQPNTAEPAVTLVFYFISSVTWPEFHGVTLWSWFSTAFCLQLCCIFSWQVSTQIDETVACTCIAQRHNQAVLHVVISNQVFTAGKKPQRPILNPGSASQCSVQHWHRTALPPALLHPCSAPGREGWALPSEQLPQKAVHLSETPP